MARSLALASNLNLVRAFSLEQAGSRPQRLPSSSSRPQRLCSRSRRHRLRSCSSWLKRLGFMRSRLPDSELVLVSKDGCQVPVPSFSGRLGFYIEGLVSPPLLDVQIRVFAEKDSHNSPLKQGEMALETTTGVDGLFLAGPLYDDTNYTIEASKPGYYVKRVGENSFSCLKLVRISVRLYSKEDKNEPFPSVLLSLSGEDGYRNNSVTGVGGNIMYGNLFPGSFYLRPLLKEYTFSPPAQPIDLGLGNPRKSYSMLHVLLSDNP